MRVLSVPRFHLALAGVVWLWLSGCATQPMATSQTPLISPPRAPSASAVSPVHTIVIDAGHGGHDPGTSHFGLREKHLALDIARRLRSELQQVGLNVIMTRDADQFIPLSGRPGIANRLQADLFISIHVNASRNRNTSGSEVYYPRDSVVSASAQWPPSVDRTEVALPTTTIRQVLWDLVLGRTRSHSRRLGAAICRSMRDTLQVPCHGVKPARFVVLREAWMPAVLVEVGYVTNQMEARRLARPDYRQAVADAIARGALSYVRELGAQL